MKRRCRDCGKEFYNKRKPRCNSCSKKYNVKRCNEKDDDYLKNVPNDILTISNDYIDTEDSYVVCR
jgi:hypothetical protein